MRFCLFNGPDSVGICFRSKTLGPTKSIFRRLNKLQLNGREVFVAFAISNCAKFFGEPTLPNNSALAATNVHAHKRVPRESLDNYLVFSDFQDPPIFKSWYFVKNPRSKKSNLCTD